MPDKNRRTWHLLTAVLAFVCLSGCADLATQQSAMAGVQVSIDELETQVADTKTTLNEAARAAQLNNQGVTARLEDLQGKLAALDDVIANTCKTVAVPVPQAQVKDCPQVADPVVVSQNDKLVLGEIEKVTLVESDFEIIARMDTGASSSSLHATNLVEFERDGDDWVRFDVHSRDEEGEPQNIERPVAKYVRVYQQADKDGSRRPVVELRISLGNVQGVFEVTLADRSHLEHGMILGRNFLTDIAIVDVSRQFVQPSTSSSE